MTYKLTEVSEPFANFQEVRDTLRREGGWLGNWHFKPWDILIEYDLMDGKGPFVKPHLLAGSLGRGAKLSRSDFSHISYGGAISMQVPDENGWETNTVYQTYRKNGSIYVLPSGAAAALNPGLGEGEDKHENCFILALSSQRKPRKLIVPAQAEIIEHPGIKLELLLAAMNK